MGRHLALLALVGVVVLAGTARADETTFCNHFITSLPYTISTQGHYCFDRNLATAITTGNAITVNSDFVVIDLNNFKLGGGSAGLSTDAVGIFANNHRNITIRNGNIRGFRFGIELVGSTGGGHLVENNVLDGNTQNAATVNGDTIVFRNNIVANTGGSSSSAAPTAVEANSYGLVSIRDNVISNTFGNGTATDTTYGVWSIGSGEVVDHNVVRMGAPSMTGYTIGIYTWGVCRDDTTLNATNPNVCGGSVGANYP